MGDCCDRSKGSHGAGCADVWERWYSQEVDRRKVAQIQLEEERRLRLEAQKKLERAKQDGLDCAEAAGRAGGIVISYMEKSLADERRRREEAEKKIGEMQAIFDLQHKRTVKADKLWSKAHNKPLTIPDLGELIDWLLSRTDKSEKSLATAQAKITELKDSLVSALKLFEIYIGAGQIPIGGEQEGNISCIEDEVESIKSILSKTPTQILARVEARIWRDAAKVVREMIVDYSGDDERQKGADTAKACAVGFLEKRAKSLESQADKLAE